MRARLLSGKDRGRGSVSFGARLRTASLGALLILVLGGLSWLVTNITAPAPAVEPEERILQNPTTADPATALPSTAPTATHAPATATPAIDPGPLTAESTDAEIRARMQGSRQQWHTLWVDARVVTEAGGVRYVDRQQAWIALPNQSRWLSGLEGEAPSLLQVTEGIDVVLVTADGERLESSAATLQIGELETLLFPAHFAARPGEFEAVRLDTAAGRLALVVEWQNDDGRVEDRLWIDVETGLVLRWENLFPGAPDSAGRVAPAEVWVVQIVIEPDFPEEIFSAEQAVDAVFPEGPGE